MPFRQVFCRGATATLAAVTVAAVVFASAGVAAADDAYDACVDGSSTNTAWAECGGAYVDREDAKLNAAWKRLMALVEGQSKTDLLAEQRAWIAYKDLACAVYDNGDWGREGQVLSFPACRAEVIAARTANLEDCITQLGQQ